MKLEDFQRQVGSGAGYTTSPGAARGLSGLLGRWDGWFYARIVGVVLRYALLAKLGRFGPRAWSRSSYAMLKIYEASGARIHIRGGGQLRELGGPVVYAANHMSVAETILLPCILLAFGPLTVIVKTSLLKYPGFGTILRSVAPVAVTRDNPREDFKIVMEQGGERLARGLSVLVFPQAHRQTAFDPGTFNTSALKLAKRAGVPIVPIALRTDFHGLGRVVKEVGRVDRDQTVHFVIGEPRRVEGRDRDIHGGVLEFLVTELSRLGVPVQAGAPAGAVEGGGASSGQCSGIS